MLLIAILFFITSFYGPEIQASSSTSSAEVSMYSSVIQTASIKQPDAIEFAEMVLKKSTITSAERKKAITLLEAKMPLASIEDARRKLASYEEDLKELEMHQKQSSMDEGICTTALQNFKSMQEASEVSYERAERPNLVQKVDNRPPVTSRASALLAIISTAQAMLNEKAGDARSDDEKSKHIQHLLYQITVSQQLAKNSGSIRAYDEDNDDNDVDVDEFFDLESYAEEAFENVRAVEEQRLALIIAKHRQIGSVLEALAPIPEIIGAQAEHNCKRIERLRMDIESAQRRLKMVRDEHKACEELIARLKIKTVA